MPAAGTEYVLTLSCPDRVGIVHAVAAYLHRAGCNVLDSQQFGDRIGGRFFMRVHVETVPGAPVTYESLYGGFAPVAADFGMEWELHDTAVQPRVLIMVSKAGLESCARYLARDLGGKGVRVNLVAAGPLRTMAAKSIPGFDRFEDVWNARAPLGWDITNPEPTARACVALLSDWFPATTGEIVHVDGGVHAVGA